MFALPSAVTLSNNMVGCNELQYEIWDDLMNINLDAAHSQREGGAELLNQGIRYLPPLIQKGFLDKGQWDL